MSRYLEKHALYPPLFPVPDEPFDIIVIIPSYNEPDIVTTLESLLECENPLLKVEVIVIVNHSETDPSAIKDRNRNTCNEISDFKQKKKPWFHLLYKEIEMTPKHAGVGLARKIGMDEALRHLSADGHMFCLDADCTVSKNYFTAIKAHFDDFKKPVGVSIYYEHQLSGPLPSQCYEAIIQYELHLRYYVDMQRRLNLPFAFHTVGSSMAVTGKAYEAVGGMNKRKAGEDFYFIQKLIKHGQFTTCHAAVVYPSPRISDRVPFGTGRAINDLLEEGSSTYLTYPPEAFDVIKKFVEWCLSYYEYGESGSIEFIPRWKSDIEIRRILEEIKTNTSDFCSFRRRYFKWFDGFQLMKLLHFLRDEGYSLIPVETSVKSVLPELKNERSRSLLAFYRKLDKSF